MTLSPLETAARLAASAKDAPELNREDVPPGFARGVAECAAWVEAQIRMVLVVDEFQRGVRAGLEAAGKVVFALSPPRFSEPPGPYLNGLLHGFDKALGSATAAIRTRATGGGV